LQNLNIYDKIDKDFFKKQERGEDLNHERRNTSKLWNYNNYMCMWKCIW